MTMATVESTENRDLYYDRMLSSLGDKKRIFHHLKRNSAGESTVVDIGCGDGSLVQALNSVGFNAVGIDASVDSFSRAKSIGIDVYAAFADEVGEVFADTPVDNIVCSAVMHEVFSYGNRSTGYQIGRVQNIVDSLSSMYRALKTGGKLIIRDGISPDSVEQVEFRAPVELVSKFLKDSPFSVDNDDSSEMDRNVVISQGDKDGVFRASPSVFAELAFTATWGEASWEREVKEYYGVLTESEMRDLAVKAGFAPVYFEEYVQQGYIYGVKDAGIDIIEHSEHGNTAPFPKTNAVWVFEKK